MELERININILNNAFFSHRHIQFHTFRWRLQHWVRLNVSITVFIQYFWKCFDPGQLKYKFHQFWFLMVHCNYSAFAAVAEQLEVIASS